MAPYSTKPVSSSENKSSSKKINSFVEISITKMSAVMLSKLPAFFQTHLFSGWAHYKGNFCLNYLSNYKFISKWVSSYNNEEYN